METEREDRRVLVGSQENKSYRMGREERDEALESAVRPEDDLFPTLPSRKAWPICPPSSRGKGDLH